MKKVSLLLFFCFSMLSAHEFFEDEDEVIEMADHNIASNEIHNKRENYFLTSTEFRIPLKVNPITGEYREAEEDLVVAGSEPLSLRRFYNSSAPHNPRYGMWIYNPESFLVANFERREQEIFASIGDYDGAIAALKRMSKNDTLFYYEVPKGFQTLQSDGQSHPLNIKITYHKLPRPKNKYCFQYKGTVVDGSGRRRSFLSPQHFWTDTIAVKKWTRSLGIKTKYYAYYNPDTWTPYQLPIIEEKLPNGNIIEYTYTPWKKEKDYYPLPKLLDSITAYNADKSQILGFIKLQYPRRKDHSPSAIQVLGSDGRSFSIEHSASPIQLINAQGKGKPSAHYDYEQNSLKKVVRPEGRIITTEYNSDKKVAAQYAPVGPDGENYPIARYSYNHYMTQLMDAEDNRIDYHFDPQLKKLKTINYLKNYRVYRAEHFVCDPITGNLTSKVINDGEGKVLQITEYRYDKNQNPIEVRMGDGKEWRVIKRTFSDDGFNLKLSESDRNGKITYFTYIPQTNLLTTELTFENERIRKRIFHTYDNCAIRIQTIEDDGSSKNINNLKDVTYRKIIKITPKKTLPCFGLPEIMEERTIDGSGNEILLSKVIYTYAPSGKILQEDHYDAKNQFCYSLYNEFDEEERLISKTDAMGAKTRYSYDANHNLLSITGPRNDQFREIVYDKANRPIRILNWQSDGTVLINEKRYNKLGQLIEEIDPYKNSTYFAYDVLGKISSITYPDGAIEQKEYDILNNVVKEIDANGYTTTKSYNAFQQPVMITYPDGSEEHFTYNSTGTLHSHQDRNGAKVVYTYDIFDHPIRIDYYGTSGKLLKSTTSTWNAFYKLSETEGDLTTYYYYDYAGRKTGEKKENRIIHIVYDDLNRIASTQHGDIRELWEYDLCDRLVRTSLYKSLLLQKEERYSYDQASNRTHTFTSQGVTETVFNNEGEPLSITDAMGNTTHFFYGHKKVRTKTTTNAIGIQTCLEYDSRDRERVCCKKNQKGKVIQRSENIYDGNGNVIELTHTLFAGLVPLKKIVHSWKYGPLNRLENFSEAGEKETRYDYDKQGRLKRIIKPDGHAIIHHYDELGRLTHYFGKGFDYRYSYDVRDRITSVFDGKKYIRRSYDPLNNLLEEEQANGLKISYLYDAEGRKIACQLPERNQIAYDYEGIFLSTVSWKGYQHCYTKYDLEGQLVEATSPLGKMHFRRNSLGHILSIQTPLFSSYYHHYDALGNLLHYTYHDGRGESVQQYQYDDLNQLIEEKGHHYGYDSLYNRTIKDCYHYDLNSLCQIKKDGEYDYQYDPCGNLISDGKRKYFYDGLDRLIALEDGSNRTEYEYDAFHRRLSKTSYFEGSQVKQVRYLWDGDNEIGILDETGKIQELRILGEGLGAEIGAALFYELHGKVYIPTHDHRGSVVVLADLENREKGCYRYSAFGEEEVEGMISPWRFSSKRLDEESGLLFFGRRYYHPKLGRWITQDPEGFKDGPNLYAYLHNSPLMDWDLYGLWSVQGFWNGTKEGIRGAGSYVWDSLTGIAHGVRSLGEWGHAHFRSDYANDHSFLYEKTERSIEGWKDAGKAAANDPFGMLLPGIMETWRNPTSPRAWGKGTVDFAMLAFTASKASRFAILSRAGKVSDATTLIHKFKNPAIASSIKQGADLSRHLGYIEKYGSSSISHLENNRFRYYGKILPANKPGEMIGRRYVHEFNPITGRSRGWHEILDNQGRIRQVRPELNNGVKRHYQFNENQNYIGNW